MCPRFPVAIYESIANDESASAEVRNAATDQLKQNEYLQQTASQMPTSLAEPASGNSQFTCTIYSLEGKYFWNTQDGQGAIQEGTVVANPTAVTFLPGKMVQDSTGFRAKGDDGSVLEDPAQKMVFEGYKAVYDFYKAAFNRNSLDDKGMEIRASIHLARGLDNAFWSGAHNQMIFGDGGRWDGRGWLMDDTGNPDDPLYDRSLSKLRVHNYLTNWLTYYDLDVIGHELTHGVVEHTANLGHEQWKNSDYTAYSEAATLNEHIADCIGIMVKHFINNHSVEQANWHLSPGHWSQICCKARGWTSDYCRTFTIPEEYKKSPDHGPKHWTKKGDFSIGRYGLDPHYNCGIGNHAFYLAALEFKDVSGGYSWQTVGRVWYAALTDNEFTKPANQTFAGWKILTLKHAELIFPNADGKTKMDRAWQGVGL